MRPGAGGMATAYTPPSGAVEANPHRGTLRRRLADKIDALSRRERVLILAATLVVLVVPAHTLVLSPMLAHKNQLSELVARQQGQIVALGERIRAFSGHRPSPNAAARAHLEQLRRKFKDLNKSLANMEKGLVPPTNMTTLLRDILRRDRGLRLVALKTLPVSNLAAKAKRASGSVKAASSAAPGGEAAARAIYRHGVKLTLKGHYADLLRYLTQLEALPWRMFWGEIRLKAKYPEATMTLTLYTLSLDKAWLST